MAAGEETTTVSVTSNTNCFGGRLKSLRQPSTLSIKCLSSSCRAEMLTWMASGRLG